LICDEAGCIRGAFRYTDACLHAQASDMIQQCPGRQLQYTTVK
jgi:hypothetical protein